MKTITIPEYDYLTMIKDLYRYHWKMVHELQDEINNYGVPLFDHSIESMSCLQLESKMHKEEMNRYKGLLVEYNVIK